MKALVFLGVRDMAVEERPDPVAAPGEVVVRVESAGICGSELEAYRGLSTRRRPPLVLGHELVVSGVDGHGGRFAVNPLFSCGACRACLAGERNRCPDRGLFSLDRNGGHAEFLAVPETALHRLEPGVTPAEGAIVEPLATVVNALGGGRESVAGRSVTVIGAGTLGLLTVALARHWEAETVTVLELNEGRRRRATAFGAIDLEPATRSQDVVIDTVGSDTTQRLALSSCRAGGVVKAVGLHSATTELARVSLVAQELRIEGVYAYSDAHFATAVELVGSRTMPLESLVSTATLVEGPEMFRRLVDDPADLVKVVLEP